MCFTDEQPDDVESRMLDPVLDRAHRRRHAGMKAVVVAVAAPGAPSVLREHRSACILGVILAATTAGLSHADMITR